MATKDVQVILKHISGIPRDNCVNTLHFEVNAPDTLEGLADGIFDAYNTNVRASMGTDVSGMDIKIYPSGLNPGGPEFQKSYAYLGSNGQGPAEIACCLSYATVDDPDASTGRRRGRIYVGPWNGAVTNEKRPNAGLRTAVIGLGEDLASVGTAGNTTWLMRSVTDNSYHKIESVWVDDAWDVQRRRGLAPTARTILDVQ